MRLDKYLKVSRLIKRRAVANDACDGARVSVNGAPAKASYQVKLGDKLEISFGQRTLKVEVTAINETAGKADAPAMYREIQKKKRPENRPLKNYMMNFLISGSAFSGSAEAVTTNSIFSSSENLSSHFRKTTNLP